MYRRLVSYIKLETKNEDESMQLCSKNWDVLITTRVRTGVSRGWCGESGLEGVDVGFKLQKDNSLRITIVGVELALPLEGSTTRPDPGSHAESFENVDRHGRFEGLNSHNAAELRRCRLTY